MMVGKKLQVAKKDLLKADLMFCENIAVVLFAAGASSPCRYQHVLSIPPLLPDDKQRSKTNNTTCISRPPPCMPLSS